MNFKKLKLVYNKRGFPLEKLPKLSRDEREKTVVYNLNMLGL